MLWQGRGDLLCICLCTHLGSEPVQGTRSSRRLLKYIHRPQLHNAAHSQTKKVTRYRFQCWTFSVNNWQKCWWTCFCRVCQQHHRFLDSIGGFILLQKYNALSLICIFRFYHQHHQNIYIFWPCRPEFKNVVIFVFTLPALAVLRLKC